MDFHPKTTIIVSGGLVPLGFFHDHHFKPILKRGRLVTDITCIDYSIPRCRLHAKLEDVLPPYHRSQILDLGVWGTGHTAE